MQEESHLVEIKPFKRIIFASYPDWHLIYMVCILGLVEGLNDIQIDQFLKDVKLDILRSFPIKEEQPASFISQGN